MRPNTLSALLVSTAIVVFAMACADLSVPASAMIVEHGVQQAPVSEQTADQVNEQMKAPSVAPPVASTRQDGTDPGADASSSPAPEMPRGGDPQAILAVTTQENNRSSHKSTPTASSGSSNLLGLAIAAAVLGLICLGAMAAVRKGPQMPAPICRDEREDAR